MLRDKQLPIDALIRITLIALITYWSFILIHPMLSVLTWGIILAVALYPIFKWTCKQLGDRPALAATLITIFNLLILVGTLTLLTNNMIDTLSSLTESIRTSDQSPLKPNPNIQQVPLIGEPVYEYWTEAHNNFSGMLNKYSSQIISTGSLMLSKIALKGFDLIMFIVSVLLSGYFMTKGKDFVSVTKKLADRLTHGHGSNLIAIMTTTIQNVSRGVIGIALFQTLLFGLMLIFTEVPAAGLLSFIALILCISQIGLLILAVPIAAWFFFYKTFTVACILTILLMIITFSDTFLKPLVLSHRLATPMLIIFIGVIGGILLYGLLGVFIGPLILALFYDLMKQWLD